MADRVKKIGWVVRILRFGSERLTSDRSQCEWKLVSGFAFGDEVDS